MGSECRLSARRRVVSEPGTNSLRSQLIRRLLPRRPDCWPCSRCCWSGRCGASGFCCITGTKDASSKFCGTRSPSIRRCNDICEAAEICAAAGRCTRSLVHDPGTHKGTSLTGGDVPAISQAWGPRSTKSVRQSSDGTVRGGKSSSGSGALSAQMKRVSTDAGERADHYDVRSQDVGAGSWLSRSHPSDFALPSFALMTLATLVATHGGAARDSPASTSRAVCQQHRYRQTAAPASAADCSG